MNRSGKYGAQDGTSSLDQRIDRIKSQIKCNISSMTDAPVLSTRWYEMAENVIAVGRFAAVENTAPVQMEKNVALQAGRKASGTLWDQENDEISVRALLEEGKLNLSLRLLQGYMQLVMNWDQFQCEIKKLSILSGLAEAKISDTEFEIACGQLLRCAIDHVEALQILDIPCLIKHCHDVIQQGIDAENYGKFCENQEGMQKSTILYYLSSVARHLEEVDEERVIEILDGHQMVPLVGQYILQQMSSYLSGQDVLQGVVFLVAVFNCEAFIVDIDKYTSPETMAIMIELKGKILEPCLASATEQNFRRELRLFLDRINQYIRKKR